MAEVERAALMEAARGGDADALDALLKQYQKQILRFGLRMCRRPEDAEDVLQETLFAAARTLHGFRGASSLSTWLYAIARSFCVKKRRRSVFAPELVSLEADPREAGAARDPAPDPEHGLQSREAADALESAIRALEPEYREILLLRDVEGLSAAEVANVTGLSIAAVKSRLHRARQEVRSRLAPLLEPSGAHTLRRPRGCPDVVLLLSRHLEGDIGRDSCSEMERHVASCSHCGSACDSLRQTLRLCRSTPSPEIPEALQESIRQGIRRLLAEVRG